MRHILTPNLEEGPKRHSRRHIRTFTHSLNINEVYFLTISLVVTPHIQKLCLGIVSSTRSHLWFNPFTLITVMKNETLTTKCACVILGPLNQFVCKSIAHQPLRHPSCFPRN